MNVASSNIIIKDYLKKRRGHKPVVDNYALVTMAFQELKREHIDLRFEMEGGRLRLSALSAKTTVSFEGDFNQFNLMKLIALFIKES